MPRRGAGRPRGGASQVRIIGGSHRGRPIGFADGPGLRPTGARIRETLFNWLAPMIRGARVLDAFAGSGALGFEAASRGATEVLMFEQSTGALARLRQNAGQLDLPQVRIQAGDSLKLLRTPPAQPRDLVLLDPPFHQGLLESTLLALVQYRWLTPCARVYIERDAKETLELPAGWAMLREKRAGQVIYGLWQAGTDAGSAVGE